ncbi:hypothetical protein [Streptomyces sp. NPDC002644]
MRAPSELADRDAQTPAPVARTESARVARTESGDLADCGAGR